MITLDDRSLISNIPLVLASLKEQLDDPLMDGECCDLVAFCDDQKWVVIEAGVSE